MVIVQLARQTTLDDMAISLRFKRKEVTVFLIVDSADSFGKVKGRLSPLVGMPVDGMWVYKGDKATLVQDVTSVGASGAKDNDTFFIANMGETLA